MDEKPDAVTELICLVKDYWAFEWTAGDRTPEAGFKAQFERSRRIDVLAAQLRSPIKSSAL